jgi:uncharacterized protein
MRISIDDIRGEGLVRDLVACAGDFPALVELVEAGEVVFEAPVAVRLRLTRVGDLVEVEGQLQTTVRLNCGRCLRDYAAPLISAFSLTYAQVLPQVEDEEEEDVELTADDLGMTLLEGDEIDFHEALQEQLLLALPFRPLCSESCRGLCPHCGADLNTTSCDCHDDGFGNKFSVLKNFKIER